MVTMKQLGSGLSYTLALFNIAGMAVARALADLGLPPHPTSEEYASAAAMLSEMGKDLLAGDKTLTQAEVIHVCTDVGEVLGRMLERLVRAGWKDTDETVCDPAVAVATLLEKVILAALNSELPEGTMHFAVPVGDFQQAFLDAGMHTAPLAPEPEPVAAKTQSKPEAEHNPLTCPECGTGAHDEDYIAVTIGLQAGQLPSFMTLLEQAGFSQQQRTVH